jgi:hypothetical protein
MDQHNDDWAKIRERLKMLDDDSKFKSLSDEIKKLLKDPEPLSIEQEVAEVIERCKADPAFYKELKAQLRELSGLPR